MRKEGMAFQLLLCMTLLITVDSFAARQERRPVQRQKSVAPVVSGVVIVAPREDLALSGVSLSSVGASLSRSLKAAGVTSIKAWFPALSFAKGNAPLASPALPSEARSRLTRLIECTLPPESDPVMVAELLARDPSIEYAEPKYIHTLYDTPNDPLFSSQNAFTRVNAVAGWSLGKGSASVLIATIDGGTYWNHEDLLPNIRINTAEDANKNGVFDAADKNGIDEDGNGFADDVVGWNFTNSTPDPSGLAATPQSYSHGTATASHFGAVADNAKGMAGSSWNCSLLPVCVASSSVDGWLDYGYEGILYAALRGAKVINCSWGRIGGFSRFEQDVISTVTDGGALVVAAAGNDNVSCDAVPSYPSNYKGVLSVGGTESTSDGLYSLSNYGLSVPVYAPGVNIISALTGGGYGNGGSGTSYSSPLVAGLAGILRAAHPTWTPAQTAAQIRMTADPIDGVNPAYSGQLGKGRVNFSRALSESHVGLDVTATTVGTSSGKRLFLPGDTILVTLTLKNVLFIDATNLTFSATTSHADVDLLDGPGTLGLLPAGQSVQLSPFRFVVGSLSSASLSVLRIRWSVNGTDADGTALNVWVFPVLPQWVMQVEGSDASLFSVRAVDRSVVWVAGGNSLASLPLVARTTDGGETWDDRTGNLSGVDLYCVNALSADRAWVGTGDGRIFATTNGGTTWSAQSYPGRQSPFINGIWMFSDGTGYAQGDPPGDAKFVVLKTTDFGSTWNHLSNEPLGTSGEASWYNSFWWTDQSHGWFGTNQIKVWRTTDGGGTWSSAATSGMNSYGVAFRDASTGYAIHESGVVARTTNGGQSWNALPSPTTDMITSVSAVPGSASAWMTTSAASFRTRNDGSEWTGETLFPFKGWLNHVSLADTGRGWVVTSFGEIMMYAPDAVTAVDDNPGAPVPMSVVLDQNYPNPFNGSSRIIYTVHGSESRLISVVVYDLLGRQIAVLAHGVHAAGEYAVEFDARNRASGVYVVVLESDATEGGTPVRLARRMVLIR